MTLQKVLWITNNTYKVLRIWFFIKLNYYLCWSTVCSTHGEIKRKRPKRRYKKIEQKPATEEDVGGGGVTPVSPFPIVFTSCFLSKDKMTTIAIASFSKFLWIEYILKRLDADWIAFKPISVSHKLRARDRILPYIELMGAEHVNGLVGHDCVNDYEQFWTS